MAGWDSASVEVVAADLLCDRGLAVRRSLEAAEVVCVGVLSRSSPESAAGDSDEWGTALVDANDEASLPGNEDEVSPFLPPGSPGTSDVNRSFVEERKLLPVFGTGACDLDVRSKKGDALASMDRR